MSSRRYLKFIRLEDSIFRRQFGVKKETFFLMLSVNKRISKGRSGPKPELSPQDQILLWLKYVRDYVSFESVGFTFGVSKSTAHRTCIFIENILIKNNNFQLPGKRNLLVIREEAVAIDVSESPVQRPTKKPANVRNRKNKQKHYYSGKKKRHTIKSQIIVEAGTKKVIASATGHGRQHDYKLFKSSKTKINPSVHALVDSAYQGIKETHFNSSTPIKRTKKRSLSKKDKIKNKIISAKRIVVENVFAQLKRFKIIAEKYRNRRKRFALRFNLIAAIYNLELN